MPKSLEQSCDRELAGRIEVPGGPPHDPVPGHAVHQNDLAVIHSALLRRIFFICLGFSQPTLTNLDHGLDAQLGAEGQGHHVEVEDLSPLLRIA